jgi:hypothetical protein
LDGPSGYSWVQGSITEEAKEAEDKRTSKTSQGVIRWPPVSAAASDDLIRASWRDEIPMATQSPIDVRTKAAKEKNDDGVGVPGRWNDERQ